MHVELGVVVASRSYERQGVGRFDLSLGAPRETAESDWVCPWRITGKDGNEVESGMIYGIDSLQALQLALRYVAAVLDRLGLDENDFAQG